jgi:hypothetical protein
VPEPARRLGLLQFRAGSDQLEAGSDVIAIAAELLARRDDVVLLIVGRQSLSGEAAASSALFRKRAESVRLAMQDKDRGVGDRVFVLETSSLDGDRLLGQREVTTIESVGLLIVPSPK